MDAIQRIYEIISERFYLEFKFYSYDNNNLTIVGSEDLLYFHEFEINFKNVFAISAPSFWRLKDNMNVIELLNQAPEMRDLNLRYRVEQGNKIFKFVTDDNVPCYIICEDVEVEEKVVKYY